MMITVVLIAGIVLSIAYVTYGSLLTRLLGVNDDTPTPAIELQDDVDYVPCDRIPLLSQHFSAIAAAGPIVGPILAGALFGWLPALLWILIGSIFVGGVHDFATIIASIRHKGQSIAEVVQQQISRRAYLLFLVFIWLALVYIIVAFTDITAASFVGRQTLENGEVISGGGIATSSLLYLILPVIMGVLMRYAGLTAGWATVIFLPLVAVSIIVGQWMPIDVAGWLQQWNPAMSAADANNQAQTVWNISLLVYCGMAAVTPMWLLLQPRGLLGGYFLFAVLVAGAAGLLMGGQPVELPAFIGWSSSSGALVPVLFITIACGACSGFHALIASGTTSKQIKRESDAKAVGYGSMLLEAMVSVVSLCCVMMLPLGSDLLKNPQPNLIYAQGIGAFLQTMGFPVAIGITFALMAFTTFVYDTLDVCTRLGRYIIQELSGSQAAWSRHLGTILTAGVPLFFLLRTSTDLDGNRIPVWRTFWSLFGASNQLLAAITLLGVTVWLWRTRRAVWIWFVAGIPTIFMYVMSIWALVSVISSKFRGGQWADPVGWVAITLIGLAILLALEAVNIILRGDQAPPTAPEAGVTSTRVT